MKSLLVLALLLPAISFAQFPGRTMPVLQLKKYRNLDNTVSFKYLMDNPRVELAIGSYSQPIKDFFRSAKEADIQKINCDGEFFIANDQFGMPYIHINSLKTCVDETGDLLSHSLGMKANLKDAEVAASVKFISEALKPVSANLPVVVNDSNKPKEAEKVGFVSPKLASKSSSK